MAAVAAALGLAVPARAQDAPENVITVHPSAPDPHEQAMLTLDEKLERRLKRSNELLRAICVGCGARDALPGARPFSPVDALHAADRAPSQMLIPHQLPDEVIVETHQITVPADGVPAPPPNATPAPAPDLPAQPNP